MVTGLLSESIDFTNIFRAQRADWSRQAKLQTQILHTLLCGGIDFLCHNEIVHTRMIAMLTVQNSELVGIYERKKTNQKNTHTPHATLQYSVIYDFNNCPTYFLFENDAFFYFLALI